MAKTSRELPVTLYPSRAKMALLLAVCAAFVAGGVLMVLNGEPKGYFCGGFFALGLPIFALQFHPRAAYLKLTREGFTFCSLFRAHTVRWEHVGALGVSSLTDVSLVGWNYAPNLPAQRGARMVGKVLSGFEAALPDTYGMKAEELAEWMERLRQEWSATSRPEERGGEAQAA